MPDFTPINTQEELNAILAPRLQRERENAVKPFADYDTIKTQLATAQKNLGEKDKTISNLTEKLNAARTDLAKTRTALSKGLPLEVVDSLKGETEEELGKAADTLASLLGAKAGHTAEPPKATEPAKGGAGAAASGSYEAGLSALLNGLNLGG